METPKKHPSIPVNAAWGGELWQEWFVGELDENGKKHGPYKTYRNDGTLGCECTFINGKEVGYFKRFHPNGEVSTIGNLNNEEKYDGLYTTYRCSQRSPELNFPADVYDKNIWKVEHDCKNNIIYAWRYYDKAGVELDASGKIICKRPKSVPVEANYDPKDTLPWRKTQQMFHQGLLVGKCEWWDEKGNLCHLQQYNDNGELQEMSHFSYDSKNQLTEKKVYVYKQPNVSGNFHYHYMKGGIWKIKEHGDFIIRDNKIKEPTFTFKAFYDEEGNKTEEKFYGKNWEEIKSYTYAKSGELLKVYENDTSKKFYYTKSGHLNSKQFSYQKGKVHIDEILDKNDILLCKITDIFREKKLFVEIKENTGNYFKSGNIFGLVRIQEIANYNANKVVDNFTPNRDKIIAKIKIANQIVTETPTYFNEISKKFKWETKLEPGVLINAKALFFDDPEIRKIGLTNSALTNYFNIDLYNGLIVNATTQSAFLQLVESILTRKREGDDENFLEKRQWLKNISAHPFPFSELKKNGTKADIKRVEWLEKELEKFEALKKIKPTVLKKLKESFEIILDKPLNKFDTKKHNYYHYFYNESILSDFMPFLNPKGMEELKTKKIPYSEDIYGYLIEEHYYDFNNSYFEVDYLLEALPLKIRKEVEKLTKSDFVKGEDIGKLIVKHKLDFRKLDLDFLPIYAKLQTDGSLFDALRGSFKHLSYNEIENHEILHIEPKFKSIINKIDANYQKVFKQLFLTPQDARCYGFYYYEKDPGEFSAIVELEKQKVIASWAATESVFSFVIVQQEK